VCFVIQPVVGVRSVFCDTACSWSEECVFVIQPVVGGGVCFCDTDCSWSEECVL